MPSLRRPLDAMFTEDLVHLRRNEGGLVKIHVHTHATYQDLTLILLHRVQPAPVKMFLLLLLAHICVAVLLPKPGGPFPVALKVSQLVDTSRSDPWKPSMQRRLMISQFNPVRSSSCHGTKKVPYMSPVIADAEDAILLPYGWPAGVLGTIEMELCSSKKSSNAFPTVLLSSGLNTTRLFYSALALEIASRGHTVITIDHPYETDIVEFPDGTIAYGGNVNRSDLASINFALDIRAEDLSFVLDDFRIEKAVAIGHSFGGAASAAVILNDARFRGGVNLDGRMFGQVLTKGLDRPFVLWGAEGHNTSSSSSDWGQFWSNLKGWRRELSLKNGAHGSFWDLPLIADISGVRDELPEDIELGLIGALLGGRVMKILGDYLDDFVNFVLKKGEEGLLSGQNPAFPEVLFLG